VLARTATKAAEVQPAATERADGGVGQEHAAESVAA
jgi:hypothetical protein